MSRIECRVNTQFAHACNGGRPSRVSLNALDVSALSSVLWLHHQQQDRYPVTIAIHGGGIASPIRRLECV
jgi:hypothetical protein